MSLKFLVQAFLPWRSSANPAVLATVTRTEGSTYTKAGAQMLIGPDGTTHGLLSGGCLEGDLAERASAVLASGAPQSVRFDMRDRTHDEIWGLGLGCDGAMDVLLTRISPGNDYAPFNAVAEAVTNLTPAAWALVIESADENVPVGASVSVAHAAAGVNVLPETVAAALETQCRQCLADGKTSLRSHAQGSLTVLACSVPLPTRLLVAGAGPDAVPAVQFANELGWSVTVVDHRPAYIERLAALGFASLHAVVPGNLGEQLELDHFDAALIMSHHLASDRDYLASLAPARTGFVGLLGPVARRERLLDDLGEQADALRGRLYAPVGLDIGADGPAGIALAAVAQIHAVIKGRSGAHFDRVTSRPPLP